MDKISDLVEEDIVRMYQFGSSVEGSIKPNDVDIFVIVSDNKYKFTKWYGANKPFVFRDHEYHYFVMPEEDGEDLLNAMLHTGIKDSNRQHKGVKVRLV